MIILTKRKNWLKLIALITIVLIASVLLIKYHIIDIDKVIIKADDFQYNAISSSAIIGGFLFTGISVLISAIDKERIKRLWNNNYLDNLYRSSFLGIISNVVTIISAVVLLCFSIGEKMERFLVCTEIVSLILGIVLFVWCVKQLIFILKRMKEND